MKDDINFIKLHFKKCHGYELNLDNPQTFSEKIQWIKLYGKLDRFAKYVDKYKVREFVKERIGEQYLIPLIGVYDNVNKIDISSLPKSFVIKATHGCGWNIIVKDKSKLDWNLARKQITSWINTNYYHLFGERQYNPLKGRIIIEELLQDPSGDLKDFKLFTFHGNPMYIQVDGNRFSGHKRDVYDSNWKRLPYKIIYKKFSEPIQRPKRLDEMIEIASKLAHDFAFARIDLYYPNDRIYFGEITFTPSNGFKRYPIEYENLLGKFIDLKKYH
ncbi:ATP-grasp fold amidoligase family protein [Ammoniphilus sp. 3BR4]|uniref:ATP-grasp fold amidoligase family protein n=1 Tax=Ammoniphilus sp. 3BR4 TaxID=3158265 RepID=UPI003467AD45